MIVLTVGLLCHVDEAVLTVGCQSCGDQVHLHEVLRHHCEGGVTVEREWVPTARRTPDEGVVVETKIDDADGVRNVRTLKRQGSLWFMPDGSMYVYYRPTHWRYAEAK